MKKKISLILLLIFVLVATNIATYKLTYDRVEFKSFLINTEYDLVALKAYDENNTKVLDLSMVSSINALFNAASKTDDLEKFSPICRSLDKKMLALVDKYNEKNRKKLDGDHDEWLENLLQSIDDGRSKIKKLCHAQE
jgi:hypothetical protein